MRPYAILMRPKKAETAVYGCHYPGDMAVRMREVLARPWVGVRVCHLLLLLFFYVNMLTSCLVNIGPCLWLQLVTELHVGIWIREKIKLKIDRSVKTPWQEYGVVAGSLVMDSWYNKYRYTFVTNLCFRLTNVLMFTDCKYRLYIVAQNLIPFRITANA